MDRKSLRWILVVLSLCVGLVGTQTAKAIVVEEGVDAPDFALETLDGEPVSLSDYRGKVVLVAFWASWCSRCLEEMAFLQGLGTSLAKDLVILAVNQEGENPSEEQLARLRAKVQRMQVDFPVLVDPDLAVWDRYKINALPTSVIVDREGKVRFAEPNYYWASQEKITGVLSDLGVLPRTGALAGEGGSPLAARERP